MNQFQKHHFGPSSEEGTREIQIFSWVDAVGWLHFSFKDLARGCALTFHALSTLSQIKSNQRLLALLPFELEDKSSFFSLFLHLHLGGHQRTCFSNLRATWLYVHQRINHLHLFVYLHLLLQRLVLGVLSEAPQEKDGSSTLEIDFQPGGWSLWIFHSWLKASCVFF